MGLGLFPAVGQISRASSFGGAGGIETASAVVSELVSVIGTTGTGFRGNDVCWRKLGKLPPGDLRSRFSVHVEVAGRVGVLAHVPQAPAEHRVSVAPRHRTPARDAELRERFPDTDVFACAVTPEGAGPA